MKKEVTLDYLSRVRIPSQFIKQLGWSEPNRDTKTTQKVCLELKDDKIIITNSTTTNKCPKCNKEFTSTYKFCPYCGEKINE